MPPSVQEAVWNWRAGTCGDVTRKTLRRRAVIQTVVMAGIGLMLEFGLGHHTVARIVWGLAAASLVIGCALPRAYARVHRWGTGLGRAAGRLLTWVLLTPLYWLVFFPVAAVMRLQGNDPLHRRLRGREYTCWIPRLHEPSPESYSRQFLFEDAVARSRLRPVGPEGGPSPAAGSRDEGQG